MIKINLLAEKKPGKSVQPAGIAPEGMGGGQNLLLVGILVIGMVVAGGWWFTLSNEESDWRQKHADADTQGQQDQCGESRRFAHGAKRVGEILPEGFVRAEPAGPEAPVLVGVDEVYQRFLLFRGKAVRGCFFAEFLHCLAYRFDDGCMIP